jgi:preprotein translocase subunit SecF
MEFLRDTNYDFMKYRKFWVWVSLLLVAGGVFSVFVHGQLNIGVDFAGGTQMTLKFRERPDLDRLRAVLAESGLEEAQLQRFDEEEENQVILRTRLLEGTEEGSRERVVAALTREFSPEAVGKTDLNAIGVDRLAQLLVRRDPDRVGAAELGAHYRGVAQKIIEARREHGFFASWEEVARVPGVSPSAVTALRESAVLGQFAVLGVENVGPQIGEELRQKGFLAVVLSLIGMLVYIWFRFELRFGVGAMMACLHDVLVTLGLYALAGFEFNLTTIAAFLTLVGYSVNDTVVIFDRIRENMRKNRREPLITLMNRSINETLSRTILTGGSTLLAVGSLLIWGGDVIRGFAFVMFVGILVGTYSSIYVASPFALLWEQLFGGEKRSSRASQPAGGRAGSRAG